MSSYMIPSVIEQTARGERVSDIYSRLLSERIVFLGTPIDDGVANAIVAQLLHLAAAEPERDVNLYINSPGGAHTSMMAIYDTMQFLPCDVATLCVGQAADSAAILLAAGAPGKRAVLEHARVLLHQPHAGVSRGSMTDLALEAAELEWVRCEAEAVLARHTGRTPDQIRSDTDRALIFHGAEAIQYGLADTVPDRQGVLAAPATIALRP